MQLACTPVQPVYSIEVRFYIQALTLPTCSFLNVIVLFPVFCFTSYLPVKWGGEQVLILSYISIVL